MFQNYAVAVLLHAVFGCIYVLMFWGITNYTALDSYISYMKINVYFKPLNTVPFFVMYCS